MAQALAQAFLSGQPDWLHLWSDGGTAAALAAFRAKGHLVVMAEWRAESTADAAALPPPLPQEIAAARQGVDGNGYLFRRALARVLVAALTGVEAAAVSIVRAPSGAPVLARSDLHLSFAARGAISVIALGTGPLGVDYEVELGPGGVAWNILRPDERAVLESLPEAGQAPAFLALWRAKEASLKAITSGLRRGPASVSIMGDLAFVAGIETPLSLYYAREAGVTLARLKTCNPA